MITNKPDFVQGSKRINLTLDPFAFVFNSFAMGDVVASVPVVKYMVENYYTDPSYYKVVAKSYFRPLFPFVPDSNFRDFDDRTDNWGIPPDFTIGVLNKKKEMQITRNTPKHMHLSTFASLVFADQIIPEKHLNYVHLVDVDVSKFQLPAKYVVLVTTYRDTTRMWYPEYILGVAKWLREIGCTPVFIGKTDMDLTAPEANIPKTSLPADISAFGMDLRNKTTLPELTSIMKNASAVCGIDSGPIHLAGTTSVPIVCGYTSVSPEHRIPHRLIGDTYAITPDIECIGCESRWRSNLWNYENCYLQHADCCKFLSTSKFIKVLKDIL